MSDNIITLTTDDTDAMRLVAHIKSEVNGLPKWAAYVDSHNVTRETVKDHALALAVLAYPNDETVQKRDGVRTRFGNAVQAAGNGLRRALPETDAEPKPVTLRVSLSGEGGGTTVIPTDHPLYAVLVEIATGSAAADNDAA